MIRNNQIGYDTIRYDRPGILNVCGRDGMKAAIQCDGHQTDRVCRLLFCRRIDRRVDGKCRLCTYAASTDD